ncbi:hypothetical protein J6P52_00015 [bacterium]|nr:hypothetical protein [bacterium]MBO6094791.1 hypothetical protein [bacterium]
MISNEMVGNVCVFSLRILILAVNVYLPGLKSLNALKLILNEEANEVNFLK